MLDRRVLLASCALVLAAAGCSTPQGSTDAGGADDGGADTGNVADGGGTDAGRDAGTTGDVGTMVDAATVMDDAATSMDDAATSMDDAATIMDDAAASMDDAATPMDAAIVMDDAAIVVNDAGNDAGVDGGLDAGCDGRTGALCPGAPASPVIDGERSTDRPDPTWTWSTPSGATRYEYRVDGGPWTSTPETVYSASRLGPGPHQFQVVACNSAGQCSPPASFTTTIERLGPGYPGVWSGIERGNLTTTAIGHVVPISCHNCYNGPGNVVYPTAMSLAKIHTALTNGADLIELDVGDSSGTLCVHHADPATCTGAPTLAEILADGTLAASDALLFVEIKEGTLDPATFATRLLDMLDAHREYVRNGRPIFVRSFDLRYVLALRVAAPSYPMIASHLRYSVLFNRTASITALEADIETVQINQLDMVELQFQQDDLAGVAHYAQSIGLGVGVWTIPGAFGDAYIAGMRELVDELTSDYRVDHARLVAEEANTFAYVDPWNCASTSIPAVGIVANATGTISTSSFVPGTAAPVGGYGTPPLIFDAPGEDRYGCSLDYRTLNGVTNRAVNLGVHNVTGNTGFLVSAVVNFDALAGLTGTQAILNSAEAGGFALETIGDGTTTSLRFGVYVGGAYRYASINVASTGLANDPSLNGTDAYLLVGVYDGNGNVHLFVDNDHAASTGPFVGGVGASTQPALIGADPQAGTPSARFFFDGLLQQISVLRWGDHSFTGSQVNDVTN